MGDLLGIAEEARKRSLYGHALRLYQRAAEEDDDLFAFFPLVEAARLLEEAGHREEAIGWYQRAAEVSAPFAPGQAARLLEEAGRVEEAIGLYRQAAEAGDRDALGRAARLLERAGRMDEAAQLRQYGLEPGHIAR